jgi:hypothetical protein
MNIQRSTFESLLVHQQSFTGRQRLPWLQPIDAVYILVSNTSAMSCIALVTQYWSRHDESMLKEMGMRTCKGANT